jgi:hypothetical protein
MDRDVACPDTHRSGSASPVRAAPGKRQQSSARSSQKTLVPPRTALRRRRASTTSRACSELARRRTRFCLGGSKTVSIAMYSTCSWMLVTIACRSWCTTKRERKNDATFEVLVVCLHRSDCIIDQSNTAKAFPFKLVHVHSRRGICSGAREGKTEGCGA